MFGLECWCGDRLERGPHATRASPRSSSSKDSSREPKSAQDRDRDGPDAGRTGRLVIPDCGARRARPRSSPRAAFVLLASSGLISPSAQGRRRATCAANYRSPRQTTTLNRAADPSPLSGKPSRADLRRLPRCRQAALERGDGRAGRCEKIADFETPTAKHPLLIAPVPCRDDLGAVTTQRGPDALSDAPRHHERRLTSPDRPTTRRRSTQSRRLGILHPLELDDERPARGARCSATTGDSSAPSLATPAGRPTYKLPRRTAGGKSLELLLWLEFCYAGADAPAPPHSR